MKQNWYDTSRTLVTFDELIVAVNTRQLLEKQI